MLPHQDYSDKWEGTLNALGSEAARAKCGMWPVGGTHPEWWGEAWKDDWPFKPRSTLKRRASTEILRGESASRRTAAAPGQSDNQTPVLGPQRSTDDTDKRPTYFVRFGPWKLQPDGGSMPSPSTASRGRGKEVLDFSLKDFQKARDDKKVPAIKKSAPRGAPEPLILRMDGGPSLVVDRDGVLLISYFPGYIGSGLQVRWFATISEPVLVLRTLKSLLLKSLGDLVSRCEPTVDKRSGDRRSNVALGEQCVEENAADLQGVENQGEGADSDDDDDDYKAQEDGPERLMGASDEDRDCVGEADEPMCVGSSEDSDVDSDCFGDDEEAAFQAKFELDQLEEEQTLESLRRGNLPASSYYWSPGWYGTGMENKRPIVISSQLKEALSPASRQATLRHLVAKRELDDRIRHLIAILHHPLYSALKRLRTRMRKRGGAVGEAVQKGWTSLFPCVAVGFNRTTRMHRDSKGFRNGLDVIGVLGNFTGGNLRFRDLNVVLEWQAGCLATFDGYDLAHAVEPWEGQCRATLISFCRSSSWRGLKLPLSVQVPTLECLKENLAQSVEDKRKAAQEIRERQQESSSNRNERQRKVKRQKLAGQFDQERQ
ncbi:hypothetical protein FRC06_002779 [Ceratobasidium sp. 370]|nr:hypothetical protein FRC06_002779 [Ceratobasidium sp. 370]